MQTRRLNTLAYISLLLHLIGCGLIPGHEVGRKHRSSDEAAQTPGTNGADQSKETPDAVLEKNIDEGKVKTDRNSTEPSQLGFETVFDARDPLANLQSITQAEAVAALEPIFNLEGQKCESCHFNWKSQIKEWALATKDQVLENRALFGTTAEQAKAVLKASPDKVKGLFKAYPEYFEAFFVSASQNAEGSPNPAFADFAASLQPPGAGGQMAFQSRSAFYQALEILLRISVTTSLETGAICKTELSESYKLHLREMQVSGFQNLYKTRKLYGCSAPGINGKTCFEDFPEQKGAAGDGKLVIQNHEIRHRLVKIQNVGTTSFWARSSMDGRFVANGDRLGKVQDLEKKIQWNFKGTKFDPSFLPNGAGLSFHGDGAIFCTLDVITREPTPDELADPTHVKWLGSERWLNLEFDPENSAHCLHGNMTAAIGTYQSVGSVIGMGTTYVLSGSHINDNGVPRSPYLDFSGVVDLFELTKKPRNFGELKPVSRFQIPGEGDTMISPSSRYISGRLAGKPGEFDEPIQFGFRLRSLKEMIASVQSNGTNSFSAKDQQDQSTLCTLSQPGNSSKAMMSLDERFMVFHLYDAPYSEGSSQALSQTNVYLFDLLFPELGPIRVTAFSGNKQALFPHFRADGWLLFIVRDNDSHSDAQNFKGDELFASDLAVQLSNHFSVLEPEQSSN